MEFVPSIKCRGCLSSDRILSLLSGTNKKCFLQILSEVSVSPRTDNQDIFLCWECNAVIARIVKFKDAVREADKGFSDSFAVNKTQSRLKHHILPSLSYIPDETEEESCEVEWQLKSEKSDDECLADYMGRVKNENKSSNVDNYVTIDKAVMSAGSRWLDSREVKRRKVKKKKKKVNHVNGVRPSKIYTEIMLDKNGISKEREEMLEKEDYINSIFKCSKCITTFPNADDMRDHETNKHSLNTPHRCGVCECYFNTEVAYNYHANRHKKRFKCKICMEIFVSRRDVVKHYNENHCYGNTMNYEKKVVKSETDEKYNTESETDTLPQFACEFCNKQFKWKTSLRKHLETHKIESGLKRKPYCETCRATFTTTANLQKHVKTSSKHQIQLRLRKIKELPTELQKSVEQITKEVNQYVKRHRCEVCGKTFQWRGNLLRHISSHEARAKGDLVCKPCNRTFSSIATFKQHLKISKKHVSENDFKYMCSECGRRFFNRTRLKDHVANVHERTCANTSKPNKIANTPALCHYCGKQAANPAKLRTHITAVHSDCSPFICEICHSIFSWHSCLSRHVRRAHGITKEKE